MASSVEGIGVVAVVWMSVMPASCTSCDPTTITHEVRRWGREIECAMLGR
jgi:hypothetical protein